MDINNKIMQGLFKRSYEKGKLTPCRVLQGKGSVGMRKCMLREARLTFQSSGSLVSVLHCWLATGFLAAAGHNLCQEVYLGLAASLL